MSTSQPNEAAVQGARNIVVSLGNLAAGERVCVVSDTETEPLGALLTRIATEHGARVTHHVVAPFPVHGTEPPADVAASMLESALVVGITSKSMAHTTARVRACERGARYLSLPEYDWDVLQHPALRIDYKACAARAKVVADRLTAAETIRVVSPGGTDITLNARGRLANFCPGYVDDRHKLGSPPDIESNISPVEDDSEGVVVIDGSIAYPGFGRMTSPVTLRVSKGRIVAFEGDAAVVQSLEALFARYPDNARVLAEFGIGFNPEAKLCGNMLMDEGCYGAFHFGFGSNATVGGKNSVPFHVDFVFYANEFWADGQRVSV